MKLDPENFQPEWEFVAATPDGHDIVAMTNFNGVLYVATGTHVYWLNKADKLEPVEFLSLPVLDPSLLEVGK